MPRNTETFGHQGPLDPSGACIEARLVWTCVCAFLGQASASDLERILEAPIDPDRVLASAAGHGLRPLVHHELARLDREVTPRQVEPATQQKLSHPRSHLLDLTVVRGMGLPRPF